MKSRKIIDLNTKESKSRSREFAKVSKVDYVLSLRGN